MGYCSFYTIIVIDVISNQIIIMSSCFGVLFVVAFMKIYVFDIEILFESI